MPALPQKRSQAPSKERKDPPERLLEGYHSTRLINRDPEKVYVFAYKGDVDTGISMYEYAGFEEVVHEEGGVRMAIKKAVPGQKIEYRGHVLMQADREEIESRKEHMQREADQREKAIVKNNTGIDPMRGINRGVLARGELRFENETSELTTE